MFNALLDKEVSGISGAVAQSMRFIKDIPAAAEQKLRLNNKKTF